MKYLYFLMIAVVLTGCKKETKEEVKEVKEARLSFTTAQYSKKTSLPCRDYCTYIDIEVPTAYNIPTVADSINDKVFKTVRNIVNSGDKRSDAKTYDQIMESFVGSYEDLVKKFPEEALIPYEAKIRGTIFYNSNNLLNIKINHYTFEGGAHGYDGDTSLLFDLKSGFSLQPKDLFNDVKSFTALAEAKFREKFRIPANKSINATGLLFEDDKFVLPKNIFYTKDGLLLYYNTLEAGSNPDGPKELLIPYSIADDYLKIK
jgi:hypothetical protein